MAFNKTLLLTGAVGLFSAALLSASLWSAQSALAFIPAQNAKPATEATATATTAETGDAVRGKRVYTDLGHCTKCHGWAGDGTGSDARHLGEVANLRETVLTFEELVTVVRCGIPGTEMPYHDAAAYSDGRCYEMTEADFGEGGGMPKKGDTFRERDIYNVVAFIEENFKGRGAITLEECEAFFKPGARACVGIGN
jgi:mono/diheme cytochrome c family protein